MKLVAVDELPARDAARLQLVGVALRLVWFSVVFGMVSGTVSVVTGLRNHSPGVFAVGLGVLADVTGPAVLIWRFRAERQRPVQSPAAETRAARQWWPLPWALSAQFSLPSRRQRWPADHARQRPL